MGVFEILFIALFILFPILEQVLKKRKGPGAGEPGPRSGRPSGPQPGSRPGPDRVESRPGEVDRPSSEREPVEAAEMVPDDLWAVLTGEQRPTRRAETGGDSAEDAHWIDTDSDAEEAAPVPEPVPAPEGPYERVEERWRGADTADTGYSPEAGALEPLDVSEAVSLERRIAPSEVRHRRFHENIDREAPPRKRRRTALARALSTPDGLRQAFVLSEVLGKPKGLE